MSKNTNLNKARAEKNDEFYTRYEDIEAEVMRYREQFENKIVLCNCDDPVESNFWQFFHRNFSFFKLKKLISTHYVEKGSSYAMIYDGCRDDVKPLTRNDQIDNNEQMDLFQMCSIESNGDFRSPECIKYLEEADIICTNPPFSIIGEFIDLVNKYNKKYLFIGPVNVICSYSNYIKENKMWVGYNPVKSFTMEDGSTKIFGNINWFTNLENTRRNEELILYREYNPNDYPKYDNYKAINVDRISEIPYNYFGYIGVPISFPFSYNKDQFDIIGVTYYKDKNPDIENIRTSDKNRSCPIINGKAKYQRMIICRKYDNSGLLVKDHYDIDGNFIK